MSYLRALEFRLSCRSVYEKVGVEFEDATNLLKNRSIFNVDCIDDLTRHRQQGHDTKRHADASGSSL